MSEWHNIGRISPVPAGTWSSKKAYKRLDIVTNSKGEKSYIALKDVPSGTALSNTAYWQLIADVSEAVANANSLAVNAVNRLTSPFTKNGDIVICNPVEQHPLNAKSIVEPVQAGSGDPSPDNVRPIMGYTGAKLTKCGKNLLPNTAYTQTKNGVTFTINADGSVTVKGKATENTTVSIAGSSANYSYMLPAGKYIFSGCKGGSATTYFMKLRSEALNPVASVNTKEDVFEHNGDPLWCYMYVFAGATVDETFYPMIRPASIADDTYTPYQGETFSADFSQPVYGGNFDWNTGVLTVDKMLITLTGTGSAELTNESSNAPNFYYALGIANACQTHDNYGAPPYGISSHYTAGTWTEAKSDPAIFGVSPTGGIGIYYEGTMAEANAWLSGQNAAGTPVQFVLNLKTPTVIQLTPQQVLGLKGVNTLYSDCGKTDVSGRIDPEWMNEQFRNAIIALGGNV